MKSLRRILLTLSMTAAMAAPAYAGSSSSEPVRVAAVTPAKHSKRMTVRHEKRSSATAQQRGNVGLDPTAGNARKLEAPLMQSRTSSMSTFLSSERTTLRKAAQKIKSKSKTRTAKGRVAAQVASQLEAFSPDALSFMDQPEPAPKKQRNKRRKKR